MLPVTTEKKKQKSKKRTQENEKTHSRKRVQNHQGAQQKLRQTLSKKWIPSTNLIKMNKKSDQKSGQMIQKMVGKMIAQAIRKNITSMAVGAVLGDAQRRETAGAVARVSKAVLGQC